MTVLERLKGCPTGATYHALRLFHTDQEIVAAHDAGLITSETREYAAPCPTHILWFFAKKSLDK